VLSHTILIAEDNPEDLFLLKRAFTRAGIQNPVRTVSSGREAIAYLARDKDFADENRFPRARILLLDLHMPNGDGFAVLEWIRNKSTSTGLLIIVLSRVDEMKNINRAYALGAHSFLTKPGESAELEQLIRSFKDYWLIKNEPPTRTQREGF
jgi:CheY-like chemotaxis protein